MIFSTITGYIELSTITNREGFSEREHLHGKEKFYWGFYFLVVVIVCFNGMVSIMTLSLDRDMSTEASRQRENYTKFSYYKYHQKWDFWPLPFNLVERTFTSHKRFIEKCKKFRLNPLSTEQKDDKKTTSSGGARSFRNTVAGRIKTENAMRKAFELEEAIDHEASNLISKQDDKLKCKEMNEKERENRERLTFNERSRRISMRFALTYLLQEDSITYLWIKKDKKVAQNDSNVNLKTFLTNRSKNSSFGKEEIENKTKLSQVPSFKKMVGITTKANSALKNLNRQQTIVKNNLMDSKIKDNLFVYLAKMDQLIKGLSFLNFILKKKIVATNILLPILRNHSD